MIVLLMNINTYFLIIGSGWEKKSTLIVQLMKWDYAPTESQKWQEHVSHDCVAHEYKYAHPNNRK